MNLIDVSLIVGYIDPATGSMVVQVIIAGVLSTSIVFRRILVAPFARLFGRGR